MRKTIASTIALACLCLAGCATTPTQTSTQVAITSIDAIVPLAVAYEVQKDPTTVPYFRAAATAVDVIAAGTNLSTAAVLAKVQAAAGTNANPLAVAAVMSGVIIYDSFFASSVDTSNNVAVLQALSGAIRMGLPPSTVKALKARKASKGQWHPAAARAGAVSTPQRIYTGLAAPWRAPATVTTNGTSYFNAKELVTTLTGTYNSGEPGDFGQLFKNNIRGGTWGLQGGMTYWLTRNFGAATEVGIFDLRSIPVGLVDYWSVLGKARLPLDFMGLPFLAPYGEFGFSREFSTACYDTVAGVGLEARLGARAGLDVGADYIWRPCWTENMLRLKASVDIAF